MNNFPCSQTPKQFVNCCQVMDCIDIKSSDNSITVEKTGCGVDLTQTGNNLDKILKINDGDCISFVKEFVQGVLNYTPQIDMDCLVETLGPDLCNLCTPANYCPAPIELSVAIAA